MSKDYAKTEYDTDSGKLTKESVDYSHGKPHAHCGLCTHFQTPHACHIVAGHIDAYMWCKKFHHR